MSASVGQAAMHSRRRRRWIPHGQVRVEHDAGARALAAASDDVVALNVRAGADAAVAQDARAVVDGDDGG